jgi:predicted nucleotidyltransferase component of viral defense system
MDLNKEYFEKILKFNNYETSRILLMFSLAKDIAKDNNDKLLLKGGTSLVLCYNLNRFSTDLDYDGMNYNIDLTNNIKKIFEENKLNLTKIILKKDTDTVKRYMIHYDESKDEPLKIEISFRNMDYFNNDINYYESKNDIITYPITQLSNFKCDTFFSRIKARDIFDVAFLLKYYPETFDKQRILKCIEKINSLGLDYFEEVMKDDKVIKNYDTETILLELNNNLSKRYNIFNNENTTVSDIGKCIRNHNKIMCVSLYETLGKYVNKDTYINLTNIIKPNKNIKITSFNYMNPQEKINVFCIEKEENDKFESWQLNKQLSHNEIKILLNLSDTNISNNKNQLSNQEDTGNSSGGRK